jgi:hypothetical protein
MLGYERYLIELYERPTLIHDWNKRVTEANIAYPRAKNPSPERSIDWSSPTI